MAFEYFYMNTAENTKPESTYKAYMQGIGSILPASVMLRMAFIGVLALIASFAR